MREEALTLKARLLSSKAASVPPLTALYVQQLKRALLRLVLVQLELLVGPVEAVLLVLRVLCKRVITVRLVATVTSHSQNLLDYPQPILRDRLLETELYK